MPLKPPGEASSSECLKVQLGAPSLVRRCSARRRDFFFGCAASTKASDQSVAFWVLNSYEKIIWRFLKIEVPTKSDWFINVCYYKWLTLDDFGIITLILRNLHMGLSNNTPTVGEFPGHNWMVSRLRYHPFPTNPCQNSSTDHVHPNA